MKNFVSHLLVFTLIVPLHSVAETPVLSPEGQQAVAELEASIQPKCRQRQAVLTEEEKKFVEETEEGLKKVSRAERFNVFNPSPDSWLGKQWEKAKLKLDLKVDETWTLGVEKNIGLGIGWTPIVQPAFIKDYQQRLDIYTVRPSLGWSNGHGLGVNVYLGGQVTFSRLFDNKWDGIRGRNECSPEAEGAFDKLGIYFLNRIPFEASELWEAGKDSKEFDLQPGEAVRLEYFTGSGVGFGKEKIGDQIKANVSFGITRDSTVIADIYKLKGSFVRVRLAATRKTAEASLGMGLNLVKSLLSGHYLGALKWLLEKWTVIRPGYFNISTSPFEVIPVSSFMADYVFDLSQESGVLAYNSIMANLKNPQNFMADLSLFKTDGQIGRALESYVETAELEYLKRIQERSILAVDRIFKGRMGTTHISHSGGYEFTKFLGGSASHQRARTNITAYDSKNEQKHYVYVSNSSNLKHVAAKFSGFEYAEGINGLFSATRRDRTMSVEYSAQMLEDMIQTADFQNKDFSKSEISDLKKKLDYSIPQISSKLDWNTLLKLKDATNGYVRTVFIIHHSAFPILMQYSNEEIETRLRNFILKHPEYKKFEQKAKVSNLTYISDSDFHNMSFLMQDLAGKMNKILHDIGIETLARHNIKNWDKLSKEEQNNKLEELKLQERFAAFDGLKNDEVFQDISMGFITSLLADKVGPKELEELIYFNLVAGARELNFEPFTYGKNGASSFYKTMEYVLSLINDRSFDLRVQLNEKGELTPYRSDQVCKGPGCDDLTPLKKSELK